MKEGGVEAYRARIQQLERELRANQSMLEDELRSAGASLYEHRPESFSQNGVRESYEEAERLHASIESDRTAIDRIRTIAERLEELEKKAARNEAELKKLQQQNIPHYEKIGQAAFEYYRENPFSDQEYVDVFRELLQVQDDLQELDKSIREAQRDIDSKPMLERMVSRGRLALLKSRRTAKLNAFPRLYRTAGERISATEFLSMNEDESISSVAGPFLENMRRIESTRTSQEKVLREREELEREVESLCEGKKPTRRVSDLEAQIRGSQEELAKRYREIGELYRKSIPAGSHPVPEVSEYLKSIDEIEKENSSRRKSVERLRAAIDVERLTRDSLSMQHSIQQLEDQIKRQQEEITQLSERITQVDQEKKRLIKLRGAEETLLET